MSDNQGQSQWLKDSEEFFQHVRSYNTTVITVGYATFFAALLFLEKRTESALVYWVFLCLVVSAAIFVSYEMIANIKLAVRASKLGTMSKSDFRYWALFYVPSLLFGISGLAILVGILLWEIWR